MAHLRIPPRPTHHAQYGLLSAQTRTESDYYAFGRTAYSLMKVVRARSRIIKLAINARHQRFPERLYTSTVLWNEADSLRSEETRRTMLHDYNLLDMYI